MNTKLNIKNLDSEDIIKLVMLHDRNHCIYGDYPLTKDKQYLSLEVKYRCGHIVNKKIFGYIQCIENLGSIDKQIQDKVKYFETLVCPKCKCNE